MGTKTAREWALLMVDEFGKTPDLIRIYQAQPKDGDEFTYCIDFVCCGLESPRYILEYCDSKHGDENNPEHWVVYKFTDVVLDETVYVKFSGLYDSWADTYWYEPKFVTPVEKFVTFYEDVK